MFRRILLFRKKCTKYQCCRKSLLSSWEEGHVATLQNPKYKWRRGETEGSRYYGNIGLADAPVLQLCCVLQTGASSGEGEARCRFGQYREQEPGAGGWGAAILLMNPGLAAVWRGGEYSVTGYYRSQQ